MGVGPFKRTLLTAPPITTTKLLPPTTTCYHLLPSPTSTIYYQAREYHGVHRQLDLYTHKDWLDIYPDIFKVRTRCAFCVFCAFRAFCAFRMSACFCGCLSHPTIRPQYEYPEIWAGNISGCTLSTGKCMDVPFTNVGDQVSLINLSTCTAPT